MAKSAEMIWLDAMEANEEGNREAALAMAEEIVSLDEGHSDAWFAIAQWTLPIDSRGKQMMPDMIQSSKTMSAIKKTVELDPQNEHAWKIGGEIMVGHLGMLEHGLEWWEGRKDAAPSDVLPYFEQVSILIRLGYFEEAGEYLEVLDRMIESQPSKSLEARAGRLRGIYEEQASMERELGFEPQNSKDDSWDLISRMRKKKPITETYFLLMFVMPIVFLLGSAAMMVVPSTLVVMLLIIAMYFGIARFSRRLLLKLNRPESFLNRAIDIECSSGKVCVPDDIRVSKLYSYVIKKRTPSFQERLGVIEQSGEPLPMNWGLDVPEL
ncbi:MAG: tetratricopeptide repeat protein [Candidatus Thalassarchaeaceae archaeon]